MVLADWEIRNLCLDAEPMIQPYDHGDKKVGKISSGESSYGYDMRLGRKFKIFTNMHGGVIDPKNAEPKHLFDLEADVCEIPPNSYVLGESLEAFDLPDDVIGIAIGKSSYARVGVLVNCTPLEPGWKGVLTIEIANLCPLPVRIYAGEGIAQIIFFRGEPCLRPYGKRSTTYQNQEGLTLARVAK